MARERPQPLPPETRTVGQLVAEADRLYGRRFRASLALGVPPAALGIALVVAPEETRLVLGLAAAPGIFTACFIAATAIVTERVPVPRDVATAFAAGVAVLLPIPLILSLFQLAGLAWIPLVAWLGLVGLVVPDAIIERLGFRGSVRRAIELGRADYVHAVGSLAALTVVALATSWMLDLLLVSQGETGRAAAAFFSVLVISPLLFLGAALLYFDQAARVVDSGTSERGRRRTDADVHPADDPDGAGRPNPEVEPRAAARGES